MFIDAGLLRGYAQAQMGIVGVTRKMLFVMGVLFNERYAERCRRKRFALEQHRGASCMSMAAMPG